MLALSGEAYYISSIEIIKILVLTSRKPTSAFFSIAGALARKLIRGRTPHFIIG